MAGTVALLKYSFDVPSHDFCVRLVEETAVLFTPGSAFELERCVRIGYANSTSILEEGLLQTSGFLRRLSTLASFSLLGDAHVSDGL
jgi:aspartate/methionine/tyrosine aminotransferase